MFAVHKHIKIALERCLNCLSPFNSGNITWESGLIPCGTRYFSSFEQQQSKLIKQHVYGTDDPEALENRPLVRFNQLIRFFVIRVFLWSLLSNCYSEAQKSLSKEGLHTGTTWMNLFYVKLCGKIVKRM